MLDFEGRVAVVTGAGAGLGKAHAVMLGSRGAFVLVNDVVAADAEAVVNEIIAAGGRAVADTHNVAEAAADIVPAALSAFGRLDAVVANAGVVKIGAFGEQSAEDFARIFDVSWRGTVDLALAAWPHLVSSGSGRLILVSSSGILGNPGSSAYGAAKGAVWGFGNSAALDGDAAGVQVSTVLPTAFTPMTQAAFPNPTISDAMRHTMGPEHVAAFVTYLAHQDTTLHGGTYQVGGGHVSRIVIAGQPRVASPDARPESWAALAPRLDAEIEPLEVYRSTGDQFGAELIAANPDMAPLLAGMNPAEATSA